MIKAVTIKDFFFAKDNILYLDEERFNELKEKGLVEKFEEEMEQKTLPRQNMVTR